MALEESHPLVHYNFGSPPLMTSRAKGVLTRAVGGPNSSRSLSRLMRTRAPPGAREMEGMIMNLYEYLGSSRSGGWNAVVVCT